MPNATYQPKRFRRSRRYRSRNIRWFFSLLGLIALFYVLTASLDRLDKETPKWARVRFPPFAIKNEPYVVSVSYRGQSQSADIEVAGSLKGDNGRNLGKLSASQDTPEATGRGDFSFFGFQVPTDANAVSIQFSVASKKVQSDRETEPRPAIRSGSIPIYPAGHKKVMRSYDLPVWQNVVLMAFEEGHWADKWGDRTVVGWGITVGYALVGWLCLYCTGMFDSRRAVSISQVFAWFWRLMAVVLFLLAINKQLDVQLLLADIGRALTKYQGWYGQRKPAQIRVLALGACLCLGCLLEIGHRLRRAPRSTLIALLGVLILGVNVVIHLVSLHSIEHVLAFSVAGVSVGDGIEVLAILWIAASAFLYSRTEREEVCYIMQ